MAAMAALISSKVWFLFIALTVVVVVGSPTTDLLESVDCLLKLVLKPRLFGQGYPTDIPLTVRDSQLPPLTLKRN